MIEMTSEEKMVLIRDKAEILTQSGFGRNDPSGNDVIVLAERIIELAKSIPDKDRQ